MILGIFKFLMWMVFNVCISGMFSAFLVNTFGLSIFKTPWVFILIILLWAVSLIVVFQPAHYLTQ